MTQQTGVLIALGLAIVAFPIGAPLLVYLLAKQDATTGRDDDLLEPRATHDVGSVPDRPIRRAEP